MKNTINLKCQCGMVSGHAIKVSPRKGNRIICMCDDCQTYAKFLGKQDKILDEHGGTDIFQLTPSQIKITYGIEYLECVRLKEGGLLRWYAGCCNTPIANTSTSSKMPIVGMPHIFMDHAYGKKGRDHDLGPVIAKIFGKYSVGKMPSDAHSKIPLGLILRSLKIITVAWLKGRNYPSPFFDKHTHKPIAHPKTLGK